MENTTSPGQLTAGPGDCYIGVDLGQKQDYTVIALVQRLKGTVYLRLLKRFRLGTEYAEILEHLKLLQAKFRILGLYIDQTGVGEVFVENARKAGLHNVVGVVLSQPKKQDLMTNLKQRMQQKLVRWPYDMDLFNELNSEVAELTEAGRTKFSHRSGTHDDRLWALALAVYGSRHETAQYHPVAMLGRRPGSLLPNIRWRDLLPNISARHPQLDNDPAPTGTLRRMCVICGSLYEAGKESPCGHVRADGTQNAPSSNGPTSSTWKTSPGMIGYYDRTFWTSGH